MDWSLVQSFLAVAETGSLSAAARALNQSQPTIGRHIKALEHALETELFQRHARGLVLSEAGLDLLPHAKAVRENMEKLRLTAAGRAGKIEGSVRLTASVFIANYVLPPILARIRAAEPGIRITLIAKDESDNLLFREADIALRMYRPTQHDIIAQHLGNVPLSLFGHPDLAAGLPEQDMAAIFRAGLVGLDANPLMIDAMQQMGLDVRAEDFAMRCDHQTVYWELVRAGCGFGFCQRAVGLADADLVEIPLAVPIPPLPVWLAAPEALRQTPRIRRVWTLLRDEMLAYLAAQR